MPSTPFALTGGCAVLVVLALHERLGGPLDGQAQPARARVLRLDGERVGLVHDALLEAVAEDLHAVGVAAVPRGGMNYDP